MMIKAYLISSLINVHNIMYYEWIYENSRKSNIMDIARLLCGTKMYGTEKS